MFKVEGLDKLQRDLQKAQDALNELDGEIGSISFDPDDPASIDAAITSMEKLIDGKLSGFDDSDIVRSLAEQMKEQYRTAILKKAAEARIKGDE